MKIYPFSKIVLMFLLSMLFIVPATAQEVVEGDELDQIEITFEGYISFDADGNILIDGYFLAPAGAISPSVLQEGQYVAVTGIFLNDETFKLTEIDLSVEEPVDCEVDVTAEECVDDTGDDTDDDTGDDTACDAEVEDCTDDTTGDDTGDDTTGDDTTCDPETTEDCDTTCDPETTEDCDDTGDEGGCTSSGHPVAARIADAFDVDACEVEALHDAGNGFGNIAKAYLLAEAANLALVDGEGEPVDAQYFIDLHDSGMGWGQIVKDSGVHPSDLAPGQLKKRADNDADTDDTEETDETTETTTSAETSVSNGNNGNNGNGNGNNGNNGNGNDNNGNNGNGNGNNGNNGNGNGNGKDKDKGKKNK